MMNDSLRLVLRMFLFVAACCLVSLSFIASVVYYADPLEMYRDRKTFTRHVFRDQKWNMPGLIRKHFIDGNDGRVAILGASILGEMNPNDARDILGVDGVYNLCTGGCVAQDNFDRLEDLLQSKTLETIIFQIHYEDFATGVYNSIPSNRNPPFLHSKGIISRLHYLLIKDFFLNSVDLLFRNIRPRDMVRYYENSTMTAKSFKVLPRNNALRRSYFFSTSYLCESEFSPLRKRLAVFARNTRKRIQRGEPLAQLPDYCSDITARLVEYAKNNPNVRFLFCFPPMNYGIQKVSKEFPDLYCSWFRFATSLSKDVPNISIHSFDDVPEVTGNQANYSDLRHPTVGVHRYALYSFRENLHRVDSDNVESYLSKTLDFWSSNGWYTDFLDTVGFEGPVDESLYREFPYPKSRYALRPDGEKNKKKDIHIFFDSNAVYDRAARYSFDATRVIFDEVAPDLNIAFNGGRTPRLEEMVYAPGGSASLSAGGDVGTPIHGGKYLVLECPGGYGVLRLPPVSDNLHSLNALSFLVSSDAAVKMTAKYYDKAGSLLFERQIRPHAANTGETASKWSYVTAAMRPAVVRNKTNGAITTEIHFKSAKGGRICLDRIAMHWNSIPDPAVRLRLDQNIKSMNFAGLRHDGGRDDFTLSAENGEIVFPFQKDAWSRVRIDGSVILTDGTKRENPEIEAGDFYLPIDVADYKSGPGGGGRESPAGVFVPHAESKRTPAFVQYGTAKEPWKAYSLTPEFFWTPVPDAQAYKFELRGPDGKYFSHETSGTSLKLPLASSLITGLPYVASVAAVFPDGSMGKPGDLLHLQLYGRDRRPQYRGEALVAGKKDAETAAILALATAMPRRREILDAIPAVWPEDGGLDRFRELLDFIDREGYQVKSFATFSPKAVKGKTIYLNLLVQERDIAPAYVLLREAHLRGIPVVAYLGWDKNMTVHSASYARDYVNLGKLNDGKLIQFGLLCNPGLTGYEKKFGEEATEAAVRRQASHFVKTYTPPPSSIFIYGTNPYLTAGIEMETHFLRQRVSFNKLFPPSKTMARDEDTVISRARTGFVSELSPEQFAKPVKKNGISWKNAWDLLESKTFLDSPEWRRRYGYAYDATAVEREFPGKIRNFSNVQATPEAFAEFTEAVKSGIPISLSIAPETYWR